MSDSLHLLCHRCGLDLTPGRGDFYVVNIEAFADPGPPDLDELHAMDQESISRQIDRLLDQMAGQSEQELMDMVHRHLTLHLCAKCYRHWIENPTG